jgi:hypothetical protein
MDKSDKSAGKFAWFCLGTLLGRKMLPKLIHLIYITIIVALSIAAYTNLVPQLLQ